MNRRAYGARRTGGRVDGGPDGKAKTREVKLAAIFTQTPLTRRVIQS